MCSVFAYNRVMCQLVGIDSNWTTWGNTHNTIWTTSGMTHNTLWFISPQSLRLGIDCDIVAVFDYTVRLVGPSCLLMNLRRILWLYAVFIWSLTKPSHAWIKKGRSIRIGRLEIMTLQTVRPVKLFQINENGPVYT